jgi:hypothetical protein
MSLDEYDAIRAKQRTLQRQINEAEAARDAALTHDPSGRVPELTNAILDSFEVVRFAVSNLAPETIRNWPYLHLRRFANVLKDLPGAPPIARETALELLLFAGEAERLERARAANADQYPTRPTEIRSTPDDESEES